jgi:hypothetical protein
MKEIIQQIERGEFMVGTNTITLKSGVEIWVSNGQQFVSFYPEAGRGFTRKERKQICIAIKKGRIIQALKIKK